jgi:hypothetical protein
MYAWTLTGAATVEGEGRLDFTMYMGYYCALTAFLHRHTFYSRLGFMGFVALDIFTGYAVVYQTKKIIMSTLAPICSVSWAQLPEPVGRVL